MSIVCGTDFSEPSISAARVAGLLAARAKVPLHLVYSSEGGSKQAGASRAQVREKLERASEQLGDTGADIHVHQAVGPIERSLLGVAAEVRAECVVVGATGVGRGPKSVLGGQADRLSQLSQLPVLVIRDQAPFERWLSGEKPLRVLLGADFTATSLAAIEWLTALASVGPLEVTAAHVYFPPDEYRRLGLSGARTFVETNETVVATLERELRDRLTGLEARAKLSLHIEPHVGRVGDRIASIASQYDLVVVGSHARNTLALLWEGSISRDVLRAATVSVACVPSSTILKEMEREVRTIVAATDFSPAGNAAVRMAYRIAPGGATIHLVHVLPRGDRDPFAPSDLLTRASPQNAEPRRRALEQLEALSGPADGRYRTETHVLESDNAAAAVSQAAERWNADIICLGTHDRGPMAAVLLGSVAQRVLTESQRPVLFARAPAL